MAKHIDTGREGEKIVVAYLEDLGYDIKVCNYRHRRAEIDIIAQSSDGVLVFVEVKTRHAGRQYHPSTAVDERKQTLMKLAACRYMEEQNYDWAIRFDVATVILHDTAHEVDYFEDVFF